MFIFLVSGDDNYEYFFPNFGNYNDVYFLDSEDEDGRGACPLKYVFTLVDLELPRMFL